MDEAFDSDRARGAHPRCGGERRARQGAGVERVLRRLREEPPWRDRIVHWHTVPAREARVAELPAALDPRVRELARARGSGRLWSHQALAIEHALAGRDVLVATPTASGKTLAFTLPVLHSLVAGERPGRALFLYPTKALTQDQTAGLAGWLAALPGEWHAHTYDGDTPPSVRRSLRERGHLVLTNPWMLHQGILPNHAKWSELFRDLSWIVVDELHSLSGVFGSSVANVLRRLLRIARHYGSEPRFLAASATLRDPAGHARRLFGRPVEVVDEDGSPAAARHFGVYDPPMVAPAAGLRANALEEARALARVVAGPAHQTIFFCRRRTAVEVLTRYLKESAPLLGLSPDEVRGYRGGYLPERRREIESGLKSGAVKVVVSTNALELGIDIGALDVCVLVGYPGSQASFWQRAGRVGRRGKPSLVVQIARSEPIDQFLVHHPEWLFAAPKERLGLDPDNLVILSEQLKCAAFELPFHAAAAAADGGEGEAKGGLAGEPEYGRAAFAPDVLDYLAEESGFLHRSGGTWYWMADAYPAQDVSLAGGEADNVVVLEIDPTHAPGEGAQRALGEVDRESSITTVHEGAIYQVEGETYRIERFDHKNRRAFARRVDTDYFTEAETQTEVRVQRLEERRVRWAEPRGLCVPPHGGGGREEDFAVWRGEVHVTTLATLYKKVRFYTRENLGAGEIHLPSEELDSESFVLTLSERTAAELGLAGAERGAAWRALGSLLRRVAPLWVRCQPSDLGLATQVRSPHFGRPAIFLYDRVQGGVGLAAALFEGYRDVLAAALDVAVRCACDAGCPACVGPREEVGPLGKQTACRLLEHLAGGSTPVVADVDEGVLALAKESAS